MKGAFSAGWLTSLVLAFNLLASHNPAQGQERTMMPVSVDENSVDLTGSQRKQRSLSLLQASSQLFVLSLQSISC